MKPVTEKNSRLRQPSRLASQPVMGVATAVATRFEVTTQAIWSGVAENVPRICGSTTLTSVMVMPNSSVVSGTIAIMSHCRPPMLDRPASPAVAVIAWDALLPSGVDLPDHAGALVEKRQDLVRLGRR